MSVKRLYNARQQFFDENGDPLSGGQLFVYVAGSSTRATTYNSSAGSVSNTNPLVLDSSGRLQAEVWITSGFGLKLILAEAGDGGAVVDPSTPIWTEDNVTGINDSTSSQDQWVSGPTPTYVSATTFTLVGDQTATFERGRRVKATVTAGTVYGTIVDSAFSAVTTVIIKTDSGTLDSGLSAVSYGIISASHSAVATATINAQPVCNGRLTLTSGTAVTTADVTAATSVYFTPYKGNTVDIYDGSANWVRYTFAELTLAVPASTVQMYDVFLQNNAGTLQLNAVAWTNDTTRATALVLQNGIYVKTGATSQLYVGSFRTTGVSGQSEDSLVKRYVWNYYNRVARPMRRAEAATTWNYTTATVRQANANVANQLDFVIGVSEDTVDARVDVGTANSTAGVAVATGLGLDSTTVANIGQSVIGQNLVVNLVAPISAAYSGLIAVGRHFIAWLESSAASGTTTWVGSSTTAGTTVTSGMTGRMWG